MTTLCLQWNLNGFFKHLPKLRLLLTHYHPQIIYLKELGREAMSFIFLNFLFLILRSKIFLYNSLLTCFMSLGDPHPKNYSGGKSEIRDEPLAPPLLPLENGKHQVGHFLEKKIYEEI